MRVTSERILPHKSTNQPSKQPTRQAKMTKPGKQPAKKPAAESDAPKATIDKGAKGGLEALFAEMSKTCAPGKSTGGPKSKPRTELPYSLNWTVHASSGQQGKNLLLKYTIFAWEKNSLTGLLGGLPCDAMWYDKDSKTNMAKVPTPEVAEILVAKVKAACSESGPKMIGELSAPDGYEAPEITIVKVDSLTIDDEETDKPFIFMVGQMFLLKDVLKQGQVRLPLPRDPVPELAAVRGLARRDHRPH